MAITGAGTARTTEIHWPVQSCFSLREAALFGFGHRHEGTFDGVMRLAFCVDAAAVEVQRLPGIGPFYSCLIVVRASGFADVLPVIEARARALAPCRHDHADVLFGEDATGTAFVDEAQSVRSHVRGRLLTQARCSNRSPFRRRRRRSV